MSTDVLIRVKNLVWVATVKVGLKFVEMQFVKQNKNHFMMIPSVVFQKTLVICIKI